MITAILDAIAEGVVVHGSDAGLAYANRAAADLLDVRLEVLRKGSRPPRLLVVSDGGGAGLRRRMTELFCDGVAQTVAHKGDAPIHDGGFRIPETEAGPPSPGALARSAARPAADGDARPSPRAILANAPDASAGVPPDSRRGTPVRARSHGRERAPALRRGHGSLHRGWRGRATLLQLALAQRRSTATFARSVP